MKRSRQKNIFAPVLIDAAEMARQHPETFSRPTAEELARVAVGVCVKVSNNSERFWVQIQNVSGRRMAGIVANVLVGSMLPGGRLTDYNYGDLIDFAEDNVFDIHAAVDSTATEG